MDDPGLMPSPLNGTGPPLHRVYEEIHALRIAVNGLQIEARHGSTRIEDIRAEQKLMVDAIRKSREDNSKAVGEIHKLINSAILWLALGAGGLLLKLIGPKLGL